MRVYGQENGFKDHQFDPYSLKSRSRFLFASITPIRASGLEASRQKREPFFPDERMKWFKHETTALKDEKIQHLMDKFGGIAYGFYFAILELCAEKIDDKLIPTIEISVGQLKRWTHIYHTKKVVMLLQSMHDLGLILLQSPLNVDTIGSNLITISVPKLLLRLDNWTKRSVVTSEQLPIEQEQEEEEEEDIKAAVKEKDYSTAFESFYNLYPKKRAKKDAFKAFEKLKPDELLLERMRVALENQKKCQDWQAEGGKFIPLPASWINGKRWEDEFSGEAESSLEKIRRIIADAKQIQEFVE